MKLVGCQQSHIEAACTRHRVLGVLCLVLLGVSCGGGSSAVSEPGSAADGSLAEVLETARAGHNVPALAAVLIQDGTIVETAAVGRRAVDGPEPVTVEDKWHLGSITKSMSSTLAAVLIERGMLDWDTTVAAVLLADIPDILEAYRDVRVEQLMTHTGGLPVDITRSAAFQAGDVNDTSALSMTERRLVWSADLLRMPPEASLGTHLYSNANYIVLGAVIEKVTGEQWEELMERELFVPLGMSETGFGAPGTPGSRTEPWGYADEGGSWQPFDPGRVDADSALALGPAGTVHSTLRDFAAYMSAHLAGGRGTDGLLGASTFARLQAPQPGTSYAGGWEVTSNGWAGSPSIWHNGSNGRWFAETVIAPDRNAAVLVVTNANSRDAVEDFVDVMIRRFEVMSD